MRRRNHPYAVASIRNSLVQANCFTSALDAVGVGYSDPDAVDRMLAESDNRHLLATFRLLVDSRDSLAWASLLHLRRGIGESLSDYIYERARVGHLKFGDALFDAHAANFPNAPRSAALAQQLIESVTRWLNDHPLPVEYPENGWGHWMIEVSGGDIVPKPTADFVALLEALDALIEEGQDLGRFLGQITPLGKDRALAESEGVRIMTMTGSKGLTVRATIIAGVDDGIVPRPDQDLGEERRLLYVAMTRSKEFLFATWAGQRRGPTARAGRQRPLRDRRRATQFFDGGPVRSQDGENYLHQRERV
ncbi:MAG TPA: 3'-5' exonuclease [Pyrinomonadaceae bacterium]|nr:3'-5' exonuclease [Pyrinomonadaceae bacterium]